MMPGSAPALREKHRIVVSRCEQQRGVYHTEKASVRGAEAGFESAFWNTRLIAKIYTESGFQKFCAVPASRSPGEAYATRPGFAKVLLVVRLGCDPPS